MDSKNRNLFVIILLLKSCTYCSCQQSQSQCEKGWFGERCQFMCHCLDHSKCDRRDGACSKGCDPQWFGPGCQYDKSEFSITGGSGSGLNWLTDNNDRTCNDGKVESIIVTLETPQPLSWVRIISDTGKEHHDQFQLSYQITTPCNSPRIRKSGEKILDILCSSRGLVNHVTLTGKVVKGLCSINISGERKSWTIDSESGSDVSWITDDDDKTCNNGNMQSITVNLHKPLRISWVSVTVRNAEHMNQFQLSYTASFQRFTPCNNHRSARVDDKTVDISCPTSDVVSHVRLSGIIVRGLCSFYVSGGRNVALKQSASQSTTFDDNKYRVTWSADKAVDGNPGIPDDIDSLRSTCSHTNPGSRDAFWRLAFSDPVEINKLMIYNRREPSRGDCCEHRLVNFTIQAFSNSGSSQAVYSYTDPGGPAQQVYTVVLSPHIDVPVGRIRFDVLGNKDKQGILALCEVYVFGEVVCPSGKFGRECKRDCNCANQTEACFVSTGGCPSGCAAGYTGEGCYTRCTKGKYGFRCAETCSAFCTHVNSCDSVSGSCHGGCQPGYQAPLCKDKCPIGRYGSGCLQSCSENCAGQDNPCHYVDGTCTQGCDPGYQGSRCQKNCTKGTYGFGCAETCSAFCAHTNSCDSVDGECMGGCQTGYQAPLCKDTLKTSADISQDRKAGLVVLGVAAPVLAIIVIVAIIRFYRRRNRPEAEAAVSKNIVGSVSGAGAMTFSRVVDSTSEPQNTLERAAVLNVDVAGAKEDNEDELYEDDDNEEQERLYANLPAEDSAVAVEKLKAYLHQHSTDSYLNDQFKSIPMNFERDRTQGCLAHNIKKNRYKNIIPYDATRVLLHSKDPKIFSDYINASYIRSFTERETIIASQGPSDDIVDDFLRMLWEQRVDRVVMLTNLVEENKKKCSMYWPNGKEQIFGMITVQLLTTRVYAEYIIRDLRLCLGKETREVTHFHFIAWPDKSVPENPWSLVDFYHRVMAKPGAGPVLVHCSAGVGRTGTFIALCNVLKEAEATGKMDFRSTLYKLRQDRMHMIQSIAQYIFLHKAALIGQLTSGTTTNVQDIPAKFRSLEGRENSGKSYQKEYDDLVMVCEEDTIMLKDGRDKPDKAMSDKTKNRLKNILPNTVFRPELRAESASEDTYINAVFVPSLKQNSQDILTQLPLPTTVTDFWRLVTQFNVGLVVAFDVDCGKTDETIGHFLPDNDAYSLMSGRFEIRSKTLSESCAVKQLSLIVQEKGMQGPSTSSEQHNLTCLLCKTITLDPESVLELVQKIQACRPRESYKTVYMCRNGADHCGLVCIQSILLDRLKVDQCLAVPLVVGAVKAIRPQVIPTLDQYICLYRVLKLQHEMSNVYGNVQDVR
ncbi:receptor-type tyrosine-protein phosphatase kappa [Plakobranchus ocellatus]|uniref:protein-tyrosine-phosphatase n=1 Tax=Plakobranchus ocellatus TaxID=259542 RepID=A0AAV3Y6N6_9GAST|nr:receptor-type tyrosine-protein phosphatase kappa [Plakobranchus ocellatus]